MKIKTLINKYRELSEGIKASLWFMICNIFQKAVSLITIPIFTRLLTAEEYGSYSEIVCAKPVLSKTTITVSSTSKKATIKWNKVLGASGYKVYSATSSDGTYSLKKTITSINTLSYTNTNLVSGKTYYYKVRAYRNVNGNVVYGPYSVVKSQKIK